MLDWIFVHFHYENFIVRGLDSRDSLHLAVDPGVDRTGGVCLQPQGHENLHRRQHFSRKIKQRSRLRSYGVDMKSWIINYFSVLIIVMKAFCT